MADEKKFKPVPKDKQTAEQRAIVEQVREDWVNHPFVKKYHGKWREYIRFAMGDQYIYYNEETGELMDVSEFVDRDVKNVYNKTLPIIRQLWGEIRYPHEYYVIPNSTDPEDVKAAKTGSISLEFTNEKGKFNTKVTRGKLWALLTGAFFWKEWWNKDVREGGLIRAESGWAWEKGQVDFNYLNPFNVRPDPTSLEREGWRWFQEGYLLPKAYVEEQYQLKHSLTPADTSEDKEISLFEKLEFTEEMVRIVERHERPSPKYPKGRLILTAVDDDYLLYEGDNNAPDHDLCYFQLPGIFPILGEPIYLSAVAMLQDRQRNHNKYCSYMDEWIQNYRIKGMIPWGSMRDEDEKVWRRAGGVDFAHFNPRFGNPYWQTPPDPPSLMLSWRQFQEDEMESAVSVRKPSLGQLPKYASRASGVLFQGLKQQDEIVLTPALEEMDLSFQDAMKFRLKLIKKHYSVSRLIKQQGRSQKLTILEFKGADLRDNYDVRVKSGVDIFTTRSKKEQVVMTMVDKAMISDPNQALELMGAKSVEDYAEDQFIDQRQAERYLDVMKRKDTYIEVDPNDNNEIHFEVFNNFRKTEEFESLSDKRKGNIRKRIEALKEATGLAEEEAEGEEMPPEAAEQASPAAPPPGMGVPPSPAPPVAQGIPPELANIPPEILEALLQAIMTQGGI
jgi:hypothetical protein